MHIQIVTVGKLKGAFKYLEKGIDEYLKRLGAYCKVEILEIPDETIAPSKTKEQILAAEAARLLPLMERAAYKIALSEHGKTYDSVRFSAEFLTRFEEGNPPYGGTGNEGSRGMIIIVGGALGLSPEVIKKADWVLSLSEMTFPHQMVRLIVLEQLYRAFRIHHNEPYHK